MISAENARKFGCFRQKKHAEVPKKRKPEALMASGGGFFETTFDKFSRDIFVALRVNHVAEPVPRPGKSFKADFALVFCGDFFAHFKGYEAVVLPVNQKNGNIRISYCRFGARFKKAEAAEKPCGKPYEQKGGGFRKAHIAADLADYPGG